MPVWKRAFCCYGAIRHNLKDPQQKGLAGFKLASPFGALENLELLAGLLVPVLLELHRQDGACDEAREHEKQAKNGMEQP